jgi:putative membrane protein
MPSEHRLHPYSVIFGFLTQIRAFIVPGLLILVGASTRGGDWEPWMMVFIIPSVAFALVRYFTYRYEYDIHELVVREGLLFRKERHIPYARIQNIDAVQNVLHRFLDVVEVRVHTGAGSTPDATMSVLPMHALAEMRRRVFADRLTDQATERAAVPASPPLLALGPRDLLLCGFIENRGAVLIAAGFGFLWEVGVMDRALGVLVGERTSGRGMIRDLIRSGIGSGVVSAERVLMGLFALVALLLAIRVLSMVWALIRLYGFTTRLDDEDLRSEFGLLTRVAATIPLHRIQALTVRETPLHRLFGRVSVSADTAGGGGSSGEGGGRRERELLAPLLRRDALGSFVSRVLGGVDVDAVAWRPVSPRAVRREIKGWLATAAMLLGATLAIAGRWGLVITPLLVAWAWIGARQTIRHLGWAHTDQAMFFRRGWLWRRLSVARVAKIQAVTLGSSPFDRRSAMARVRVDTAGASMADRIDVPYLPADVAGHLHATLVRGAGETTFKW